MTSRIFSGATMGFDSHLIEVESDASAGLPSLSIVGLGGKAIIEARERVRSAITNSQLDFPSRRVTINLAPADLPKSGTHFDLPIALAILTISGQLRNADTADTLFAGELALDGSLRPIKGAIHLAELARGCGIRRLIIPRQNGAQAALIRGIEIIGCTSLQEVFLYLKRQCSIAPAERLTTANGRVGPSLDDVRGQDQAKRALAIAAAGHHNILLSGPPGAGKTMLARVLKGLLPPMTDDEKIATTKLSSLTGESIDAIMTTRPFRAPHHTASRTALIGGASLLPGEISLAHLGVLFLDELPEYPRTSLEALRQPLEDRTITISRTGGSVTFPADFMLVATKNPCPCGYLGDPAHACTCSPAALTHYAERLSGPLLDRIDLHVPVARVPHEDLFDNTTENGTSRHDMVREAVRSARHAQSSRYGTGRTNAGLTSRELRALVPVGGDVHGFLLAAAKKLTLSARSTFKVIRIARSIADLDGASDIAVAHVGEALQYRPPTP